MPTKTKDFSQFTMMERRVAMYELMVIANAQREHANVILARMDNRIQTLNTDVMRLYAAVGRTNTKLDVLTNAVGSLLVVQPTGAVLGAEAREELQNAARDARVEFKPGDIGPVPDGEEPEELLPPEHDEEEPESGGFTSLSVDDAQWARTLTNQLTGGKLDNMRRRTVTFTRQEEKALRAILHALVTADNTQSNGLQFVYSKSRSRWNDL